MLFATFGGSHAYGTNKPTSDIDIRGCALNSKRDLLGRTNFEQMIDNETDTTIYAFRRRQFSLLAVMLTSSFGDWNVQLPVIVCHRPRKRNTH